MIQLLSTLRSFNCINKRVLVRADLNVDTNNEKRILSTTRLERFLPTLDAIAQQGGTSIIITHRGRPKEISPTLSTEPLATWLSEHGHPTLFARSLEEVEKYSADRGGKSCILLENIRFFPGEQKKELAFAKQLAALGDYYVNDAFGTLHRDETSITLLPLLFEQSHRSIGLLVEQELQHLNRLFMHPKKPFVCVIGGSKISTKLPLIENLIPRIQILLLCPALSFTFSHVQGKQVGKSLIKPHYFEYAQRLLHKARSVGTQIILPEDYQTTNASFEKPYPLHIKSRLSSQDIGISIGPHTARMYTQCITHAKTVFVNGLPGNITYPETLEGIRAIFNALSHNNGMRIIGGGDTLSAVSLLGFDEQIGYLSTGGGSTLSYLSGQPLIGLLPFLQS